MNFLMIEKFDSSNRGSLLKKLGVAAMLLLVAAILLAVWLFVYIIITQGWIRPWLISNLPALKQSGQ